MGKRKQVNRSWDETYGGSLINERKKNAIETHSANRVRVRPTGEWRDDYGSHKIWQDQDETAERLRRTTKDRTRGNRGEAACY